MRKCADVFRSFRVLISGFYFRYSLVQLLNSRYMEKNKEKWWNNNKSKCEKVSEPAEGISIQNIGGVFIVIFAGVGMACVTLALNYYEHKKSTRITYLSTQNQSKLLMPSKRRPGKIVKQKNMKIRRRVVKLPQ